MKVIRALGIFLVGLLLGTGLPASSQTPPGALRLCVEWDTKQVLYSKFWDRCPARTSAYEIGGLGANQTRSEILSGSEVPDVLVGKLGDFYLQVPSGNFYGPKTESGWSNVTRLGGGGSSGPAGPAGPAGAAGADGADGEDAFSPEAPINFDQIAKLGPEDSLLLNFDLLNITGGSLDLSAGTKSIFFVFYLADGGRCAKPNTSTAFSPEFTTYVRQASGTWADGSTANYLVKLENITHELGACPAVGYKVYFRLSGIGPNGGYSPELIESGIPVVGFVGQTYNRPQLILAPQA